MPSFGTLKADTLTHSTAGSVDTNYVVTGTPNTWGMIDMPNDFATGANAAIDSSNISSVTDDSTGNTTLALTNAHTSKTTRTVVTGGVVSNKMTAFNTNSTASQVRLQATDADTDAEQDQVQTFMALGELA